jgi:hypothetical protein
MRFAKTVFWIAGIWGVLVIAPLYFMFDVISRNDPPPITHPGFFYGFAGAALAWQIAFFFIAKDPMRHRPLMLPLKNSVTEPLYSFWFCGAACTAQTSSSAWSTCCLGFFL